MAGLSTGFDRPLYGTTYNGKVWDPATKTYVAPTQPSQNKAAIAGNDAVSANIGPQSAAQTSILQNEAARSSPEYVSPMDAASIEASKASTGLAGQKENFSEDMSRQRASMISGIVNSMQKNVGTVTPIGGLGLGAGGPAPLSLDQTPYDQSAENAAYGAAKDRTANASAAALKGLEGVMNARGISGSGIEAANTRGIFENAVGELGATDRQLAEGRANRAYDAEGANADRTERSREFNLNYAHDEAARVQAAQLAQLSAMLQAAGLY